MKRHARGPAFPRTRRQHKFDGQGGFAPNSGSIPPRVIPGLIVFFLVCAAVVKIGAVVGF
ncbi:hypothetical protein ACSBPU_13015 [Parapusillimonas sp. JC17]|uniref:hypothetical protein n=1 Tax=Parapusillimonas sp. JC17 TaxID=3445768 RepID=UPI003F9F9E5D